MAVCVAFPLWEEEAGSRFVAITSLKVKDAVLSFIRAGLEAGTQLLNQDSPPELLCHL